MNQRYKFISHKQNSTKHSFQQILFGTNVTCNVAKDILRCLALISRNPKERTADLCRERLAHLVNEVLPDFVETSASSARWFLPVHLAAYLPKWLAIDQNGPDVSSRGY